MNFFPHFTFNKSPPWRNWTNFLTDATTRAHRCTETNCRFKSIVCVVCALLSACRVDPLAPPTKPRSLFSRQKFSSWSFSICSFLFLDFRQGFTQTDVFPFLSVPAQRRLRCHHIVLEPRNVFLKTIWTLLGTQICNFLVLTSVQGIQTLDSYC